MVREVREMSKREEARKDVRLRRIVESRATIPIPWFEPHFIQVVIVY